MEDTTFVPPGVPIRIYGGYLEARAALRADAFSVATRTLEWLLGHLAEERGAKPEQTFAVKLTRLRDEGVISGGALLDQALSTSDAARRAWALMSVAEHSFYRLYLRH